MNNLVETQDLTVEYPGGHTALSGVDFSLKSGETLGIVGESGSGKTTLIRTLINLPSAGAKISRGRIIFDGRDTAGLSAEQWRRLRGGRIAMIFQNPGASLNPMISVKRQFVEAICNHRKMTKKQAGAIALEQVEALGFQDPSAVLSSRPWQLSGGMKQRVAIGISLAMNPDLILADEPTSALDVTTQETIMKEFETRRREQGAAIIMVSHNICACAWIADRLLVMKDGRVIDYDTTEAILSRPGNTYAGQLLQAVPHLKAMQHE